MDCYKKAKVWFLTGSQHLYGEETLKQVDANSKKIVDSLNAAGTLPVELVWKPVLTTPDAVTRIMRQVNAEEMCAGVITWMHTFSPAKMWIQGLQELRLPVVHLHTQTGRDIPWDTIDMDFMNLNQSAHGGREYGFIGARMGVERTVITGHWHDKAVHSELADWIRTAVALWDSRSMKVARFGDNMREVAVTEGNKVSAQMRFGYSVNGYGVGDLTNMVNAVEAGRGEKLVAEYFDQYQVDQNIKSSEASLESIKKAAKIELGMRDFLTQGGFSAFTTTFEDLYGLPQLPGIAVQRLMSDGYGFGAEGDWKTAALVRTMKVLGYGGTGGTSFMEDYTYHMDPAGPLVLGAHMLEVCPSIADAKPKLEVHPLGIGGKEDPVRLTFNGKAGEALNATLVDLGNRFRMIVNTVTAKTSEKALPKLPVAQALWNPHPDLKTAASAWITAGGAHHTGYSLDVSVEQLEIFAGMTGIEFVLIDRDTTLRQIRKELRWNEAYYHMSSGYRG